MAESLVLVPYKNMLLLLLDKNSGANIDETYIAVGPSAPPMIPVAAACFNENVINRND